MPRFSVSPATKRKREEKLWTSQTGKGAEETHEVNEGSGKMPTYLTVEEKKKTKLKSP